MSSIAATPSPTAISLASVLPQLQEATAALSAVVTQLQTQSSGGAAAGPSVIAGGPPTGAAACCGAMAAAAGADAVGQAPATAPGAGQPSVQAGGGASGAPAPPSSAATQSPSTASAPGAQAAPEPPTSGTTDADAAAAIEATAAAPPATGTSRGQQLLDVAMAQLGKPYEYGAEGPNSFDCSGLTDYAAKALGISIPRSAKDLGSAGTPVAEGDLQPGDLVLFENTNGPGITHVGIYIGDGDFVHAPQPGEVVKVSNLEGSYWAEHYAGARRIV